jgi:hypothetical protein
MRSIALAAVVVLSQITFHAAAQLSCPSGFPVVSTAPSQSGIGDGVSFDIAFPGQTVVGSAALLACDVLADLDPSWPSGEYIDVYLVGPGGALVTIGRISAIGECSLGSASLPIAAADFNAALSTGGVITTRWVPSASVNNYCPGSRVDARLERCSDSVILTSPLFTPFQFGSPAAVSFSNVPLAGGDVSIDVTINADVNTTSEFVPLLMNGVQLGLLSSGGKCVASVESIVVPAATFNAALGGTSTASFSATPPSSVGYCPGSLSFTVTYVPGAHAATIRVPQDHATIQSAIDAAVDGQTIIVDPGTYQGFQLQAKTVDIVPSSTNGSVVIQAPGARGIVFGPGADGSSVSGCTIEGAGASGGGIEVQSANGIQLADCEIRASAASSGAGIRVTAGGSVRMLRGSISGCVSAGSIVEADGLGSSIALDDVEVRGNRVTGTTGALLRSSGSSVVDPLLRSSIELDSCALSDNHCGRSIVEVSSSQAGVAGVRSCTIERSNFLSSSARIFRVVTGDGAGSMFSDNALCGSYPAVAIDAITQIGNVQLAGCDCEVGCDLQWASSVLGYSSQYSSSSWSAAQALGAPNTWAYGDISTSWAPCCSSGTHSLSLAFPVPVRSEGCVVRETYSCPFVQQISAIDVHGVAHVVWTAGPGSSDAAVANMPSNSYFTWPRTSFLTRGLAIVVSNSGSWEEVDAMGLIGEVSTEDCDGDGVIDAVEILGNPALDGDGNGLLDDCECRGDVNADALVNGVDLAIVLSAWDGTSSPAADVNADGVVNGTDLAFVLAGWGICP